MVKRPVIYEDRYPDSENPRVSGYSRSKQQAEHTFAAAAESSGAWDSITCCPADNVGPIPIKILIDAQNEPTQRLELSPLRCIEMSVLGKFPETAYRFGANPRFRIRQIGLQPLDKSHPQLLR